MAFLDFFQKKTAVRADAKGVVYAPLKGRRIPLEQVSDTAFSQKLLGDGIAIIPEADTVFAPVSGKVVSLFETHHAIGIRSKDGMEILIHIGIDTVELGGKGFRSFVNKGEQVSLGQKLITFDREQIKAAGYDDTTMLLVLNANDWRRLEINQTDCLEPSMKAMWFV